MQRRAVIAGLGVLLFGAALRPAAAQVRVNPTGVSVSSMSATTVLLTAPVCVDGPLVVQAAEGEEDGRRRILVR